MANEVDLNHLVTPKSLRGIHFFQLLEYMPNSSS